MKKLLLTITSIIMILALASCTAKPSSSEQKTTAKIEETLPTDYEGPEYTYYEDFNLPKPSAEQQAMYEKYLKKYSLVAAFLYDWDEKDHSKIPGMMDFYHVVAGYKRMSKYSVGGFGYGEYNIPFDEIKTVIQSRLEITDEDLKNCISELYDAKTDKYNYYSGMGGGEPIPIITKSDTQSDMLTLYIDNYWEYHRDQTVNQDTGKTEPVLYYKQILKIKLLPNGEYKFLSNKVTVINHQ